MSLKPKRILMLANEDIYHPNGGLGVHVGAIAKLLAQDPRFEIFVLHRPWKQQGGFELRDGIHLVGVENHNTYNTKHGFINKMQTDFNFTQTALEHLGHKEFDLIHCHDGNLWQVVRMLKGLYNCPTLLTLHLSFFLAHPPEPDNPYYLYDMQLETAAIHEADHVITVSKSYGKMLEKSFFFDASPTIIPNAVDASFLAQVPYDPELRQTYGTKPLVVYVGRLVPTKGVHLVIEAIHALPEFFFVLVAVTSPTIEPVSPLSGELRAMAKQISNFQWINFCEQDLKWRLMRCADIGIMPSLHEPFGIVALEWMGIGTPRIVSNRGGLRDFCTEENAVVIEPTNSNLIEAILTFKRSKERIQNGLKTAQEHSWPRVVEQISNVYMEMT